MALVKICPTCSLSNPATVAFCSNDGVSLVAVQPLEEVKPDIPIDNPEIRCPECSATNKSGARACAYCNGVLEKEDIAEDQIEVKWPWGEKTFHTCLRIGRESPAPPFLIKWLAEKGLNNVSRVHADISVEGGEILVEDLGSTNGTFWGNERLTAREKRKLGKKATLRIASNVLCEIQVSRASREAMNS